MPYRPNIQDRSGEMLARGIDSAGQSLGGALQFIGAQRQQDAQREMRAQEEIDEYRGGLDYLAQAGIPEITPEFLEKFDSASLGQKRGMYAQVSAAVSRRLREQQQEETFARQAGLRELTHRLSLSRSAMADARAQQRAAEAAEDQMELAGALMDYGDLTPRQMATIEQVDDPEGRAFLLRSFQTRNSAEAQQKDASREAMVEREIQRRRGAQPLQPILLPDGSESGLYRDPATGKQLELPDGALFPGGGTMSGRAFLDEMGYGD